MIFVGIPDDKKFLMTKGIRPTTPSRIIEVMCEFLNTDIDTFKGASRKRPLVEGRQIAMAFIRYGNPKLSLKHIGMMFGNRDHSTVIYSIENYESLLNADKSFRVKVAQIKALL